MSKQSLNRQGKVTAANPAAESYPVETQDITPQEEEREEEENVLDENVLLHDPLTEAQKKIIMKIHVNAGHPSKEEFLRALRLSRAKRKVLAYVRKAFQCNACDARGTVPKARPPASFPRTFRFNETVGIDLFEVDNGMGGKSWLVNMVCWGTLYQICVVTPDKTAATISRIFAEYWIRYFWTPVGPHSRCWRRIHWRRIQIHVRQRVDSTAHHRLSCAMAKWSHRASRRYL